jgi:ribosomal protein L37AE/L43A
MISLLELEIPTEMYCPYCGTNSLKHVRGVPRCRSCRAVFFVQFSRYTRRSPSARHVELKEGER